MTTLLDYHSLYSGIIGKEIKKYEEAMMILYPTKLTYYDDPYKTNHTTYIVRAVEEDDKLELVFDSTIFYPFGGGQPSDQGTITTATGKAEVRNVQIRDGIVFHECKLIEGGIEDDQDADLELDWERRHWNMRVHTAGHIIHDILTQRIEGLTPLRGNHGSKPYLEYKADKEVDILVKDALETEINEVVKEGKTVVTRETNSDELQKIAKYIPPNLPKGKPLRMIQIDGYPAMPDGGTQVKDLREIGKIELTSMSIRKGQLTVNYRVHSS